MLQTLDFVVKNTWSCVYKMYNLLASDYGANFTVGYALLKIDKEEGIPSTSLAPKLGMEPTSLTRTLKIMEDQGLIRREKNPKDGRGVLIFLTPFGMEKRALTKEVVIGFNEELRNRLGEKKLQTYMQISEEISETAREYALKNK